MEEDRIASTTKNARKAYVMEAAYYPTSAFPSPEYDQTLTSNLMPMIIEEDKRSSQGSE